MNVNADMENEKKWRHFLSEVKQSRNRWTRNDHIQKKTTTDCLANDFANKLLAKKGGTVSVYGPKYSIEKVLNELNLTPPRAESNTSSFSDAKRENSRPSISHGKTFDGNDSSFQAKDCVKRDLLSSFWPVESSNRIYSENENNIELNRDKPDNFVKNSKKILKLGQEQNSTRVEPLRDNGTKSETAKRGGFENIEHQQAYDNDKSENRGGFEELNDYIYIDDSSDDDVENINGERGLSEDDYNTPTKLKKLDFSNENGIQGEEKGRFDFPATGIKYITVDIEIDRSRDRDFYFRPIDTKSDIDLACSKWKISNIAEYFVFDKCVRTMDLSFCRNVICEKDMFTVLNDITRLIGVLRAASPMKTKSNLPDSFGSSLKTTTINETGTRLVIDAFLIPLCSMLNLTIGVDINVNCTYLPNCRFDYCIYKDNKTIGCVEAKSPRTLDESSIAQAIVQLNILQAQRITKADDKSSDKNLPIFCVITDGYRFIFIQIVGNFLFFQTDEQKNKLQINEIHTEDEIMDVMYDIASLIGESCKGGWVYDKELDNSIAEERKREIALKNEKCEKVGSSSQSPICIE